MSKESKEIIKNKEEKVKKTDLLDDVKIISTISTVNYIQTLEKGIFVWTSPTGTTFEDHYKMIDFIKEKTQEAEKIRKQQEEEAKKKAEEEKLKEEKKVD